MAPGLFTARLDGGLAPDWDLAIFRPGARAAAAAATSVASQEQASLWVKPGEVLAIQACRRAGDATIPLTLDLFPMALPTGATERFSLESVPISGLSDVARLEGLGLDVTHDVSADAATVALYSDAERAALAAAGFVSHTLVDDLAAADRRDRAAEAEAAEVGAASALPSGRETYRVYADYTTDMQQLAEQNPGLVRRFSIGSTLEGNSIDALEIAANVDRQDDGRPVYLNLGVHHAREWPSGEFPMEFAHDLVNGYGTDPRITSLLERLRVIIVPVVNIDGFLVSRSFGETPADGNQNATLGLSATDAAAYKRKTCRAPRPELQAVPCAARPAVFGVDPNRNYGAYWGGVGSSSDATAQNYRGTAPYSEPEPEAIHQLSSRLHPTMVVSNHTFTAGGTWLRQPGFRHAIFTNNQVPDEAAMADLGAGMAAATGWANQLGWAIGDITGATEDWNYFAQGAYGYTPEAKGPNFHANYATMVAGEYVGTGPRAGLGIREAFLLAGERAANPADHSVVEGTAPPGATLQLRKSFQTPTCQPSCQAPTLFVEDELDTTLTVPADGTYEWHVNQSTRPMVTQTEFWTMTCQVAGEEASTTTFAVARGARFTPEWTDGSCAPEVAPNEPPVASFTYSPSKPRTGQAVTFTSTSTDPENAIALYEWDLDDDGAFDDATGATVAWTFAAAGPRDASLRVTDGGGATDVVTRRLQVRGAR